MEITETALNARSLALEYEWFSGMLDARFRRYFENSKEKSRINDLPAPDLSEDPSTYARVVMHYQMSIEDRLILLLALAPHIYPQMLDIFFTKNANYDRVFTEFGGVKGIQHGGFLPTGETAAFLIAGNDLAQRMEVLRKFDPDYYFNRHKILNLESESGEEPLLSGKLVISREYISYFTSGEEFKPRFSTRFPAQRITTGLDWDDLVLDSFIIEQIEEIHAWLQHKETILDDWGLRNKIRPGYLSLFYGPSGTGKTLTASLLGKASGREVYRVDISKIVSKYIGETEKNMANIFDQAENRDWILFFDEADALFGKRTSTSDAKDRYANQEVAYLLQRIEDFPGVIILASNLKGNIDDAFARRFQSMIYFPVPDAAQRLRLWENAFSRKELLAPDVDLSQIAEDYELTGGAITNILRHCTLSALRKGESVVHKEDIQAGIRRELQKEGKTL
jgi:hypothetical protein